MPSKFCIKIQLFKVNKWCYYDFLISLLVSYLQKTSRSFLSRCSSVLWVAPAQSCIGGFHFFNVAIDSFKQVKDKFRQKSQNNYRSSYFLAKTILDNADMPCQRLIYKFRDFKIESWQKLRNLDVILKFWGQKIVLNA